LVLRASEQARALVHLPHVLYHRRKLVSEAAPELNSAGWGTDRQALQEHLARQGSAGEVQNGLEPGTYQVVYHPQERPLVSIIIPNKDLVDMLARCLESIRQSSYSHYEILVVENGSRQPETFAFYQSMARDPRIKVLTWNKPFNYAALNNFAVEHCAGEVLLFLNNDMQAITPTWLERLLGHALRPQVGAVGAMLWYADDTVQHAGQVLLQDAGSCHVHRFAPRGATGHGKRLVTVRNVSLVTGACLMIRKNVFREIGGFDERFAIVCNDTDLCLKVRERGYLIVWTPHAQLYHFESVSRGYNDKGEKENQLFMEKWKNVVQRGDPYFSPHLWVDGSECCIRL
jgi:GT2 family glycosyltransferase